LTFLPFKDRGVDGPKKYIISEKGLMTVKCMEEIRELIKKHNLEENSEYVIIPFVTSDGRKKRCFLLKRRFMRIADKDGRYFDYTLAEAIEALLRYPDMKLSEAVLLMYGDAAERSRFAGQAEQIDQARREMEDGNPANDHALQA
jgi:hypothetical protein